jgi:hypothetical protein
MHHEWSHHWPVLVAGAVTFLTGGLLLAMVIVMIWPVPPVEARIEVTARAVQASGTISMTVANRTPAVLEAITRLSNAQGQSTRYSTLGQSAFLVETLGQTNDVTGRWQVFINGREVTDLAAATLQPGDELQLRRIPNP